MCGESEGGKRGGGYGEEELSAVDELETLTSYHICDYCIAPVGEL